MAKSDGANTNTQRAMWSVLITALVAPFLAAMAAASLSLGAPLLAGAVPGLAVPSPGEAALATFAWSAFPATVTALALVPFVLERGGYSWLAAAVAGVLAFMAALIILPFAHGGFVPPLAFAAGLAAIAMRALLIKLRILVSV